METVIVVLTTGYDIQGLVENGVKFATFRRGSGSARLLAMIGRCQAGDGKA